MNEPKDTLLNEISQSQKNTTTWSPLYEEPKIVKLTATVRHGGSQGRGGGNEEVKGTESQLCTMRSPRDLAHSTGPAS